MAGGKKKSQRGESKTSPRRVNVALRRAQALQLRADGLTHEEIAQQLNYKTRAALTQDLQRAMLAVVAEPAEEVRALELARLDMLWRRAMEVLVRQHVTVSHGKVVQLNGEPLLDDGPVLAAIDRLLRIQERRAKLLGLDAPTRHEVVTLDLIESEIKKLTAELDRTEAAAAAGAAPAED